MARPIHRLENKAEWIPGAVVGRYALLAKIATGGMAEIWLADQAGLQGFKKLVVIKRILESYSKNKDFVSMFLDEARIAAQLNHPNVVQIFDLGEHGGAYYIAMEYLPGENLSAVVRTGMKKGTPLPLALAARIIAGAAAGLGHAHTKLGSDGKPLGIVHRDVSPQNLIITLDGNVKVVDFGVARAANRATQTTDGHIKGKIAYMSPEQAAGTTVDARSDVFGLGVILFEAVTGTRFYPSPEMTAMIGLLCGAGPLPKAMERNPRVPEALSLIIDKALSRDSAGRYATAAQLQTALEGWLHTQPEQIGPDAVEVYLKGLFGEAWGKRSEFIEAARAGSLTPSGLRKNLGGHTEVTMPGNTRDDLPAHKPPSKVPLLVGAAIGLVLLLGVGFLISQSNRQQTAIVVELPVNPPPPPPVEKVGALRIETEPTGAQVTIDGVMRGAAPLDATGVKLGEHEVSASLTGRTTVTRKVALQNAGDRVQLMLALPAEMKATVKPTGNKQAVAGSGKLTLQTTPWTEVFLGNKSLGESPLLEVPLPAGKYTLRLVNAEAGVKTSIEVEIAAGKTTVKKLKF